MAHWENLLGFCAADYEPYSGGFFHFPPIWQFWLIMRLLCFVPGFFIYLYVMLCFLFRKVSRGLFCGDQALTLFLIVSICVFIYASLWLAVSLALIIGIVQEHSHLQYLLFWAWDFSYLLEGTCPLFCTLILAMFRFYSICRPVRELCTKVSCRKLWESLVVYFSLLFISSIPKKVIGCREVLSISIDSQSYAAFGIVYYTMFFCIVPLVCLIFISFFHYKTTNHLRSGYNRELRTLLGSKTSLFELKRLNEPKSSRKRTSTEETLREERKQLKMVQTYISLVTPALFMKAATLQVNELYTIITGHYFWSAAPHWFKVVELILLLYVDILFMLEFVFFLLTDPQFRQCLSAPFKDSKRPWPRRSINACRPHTKSEQFIEEAETQAKNTFV